MMVVLALAGLTFWVWYNLVRQTPVEQSTKEQAHLRDTQEKLLKENMAEKDQYKYIVLINPSHGGKDAGEKSADRTEKEVTLAIAKKVQELNTNKQIGVFLIRNEDVDVDETIRRAFIEGLEPDLFIDLHVGKKPQVDTAGTTVYYTTDYYNPKLTNVELADMMERSVVTAIEGVATGIFEDTEGKYTLLENTGCPSVAIEAGCLAGEVEGVLLGRESYQENIAKGMLETIYEAYKRTGDI